MALIRRIVQSSENLFLFKTNQLSLKNNCNVDFASFAKKVDLPLPPKRPLTAYMIFCKEKRSDVLKDHPSLSSPEQIRMLAEKWSNLSNDLKRPYEISAREGTVLYGEAHKKFYEKLTEDQKEEMARLKSQKRESRRLLKLKKALKESGLPKSATPTYALFVQSQSQSKDKGEIKQVHEFMKQVAEKWKTLSDDEKKEFEAKAVTDKKRFATEIEQWRKQMIAEGKTSLLKDYIGLKGRGKIGTDDDIQQYLLQTKKEVAPGRKRGTKKTDVPKN